MRVLALLCLLSVAACAGPRGATLPAPPAAVAASVDEEPAEGEIPDGIVPLAKEQADAVAKMERGPLTP